MPRADATLCPLASLISEQAEVQQLSERAGDEVGLSTPGHNWRRLAAAKLALEALTEKSELADGMYRSALPWSDFRTRYAAADSKAVRARALALECEGSACK